MNKITTELWTFLQYVQKKWRRCLLVIIRQRLHIVFLSVSSFSFLISWHKPKCFHKSGLKLAGTSAVSQTLSLSSPSATFTWSVKAWIVQRIMGTHGAEGNCSSHFLSALFYFLHRRFIVWNRHVHDFCHRDTATLPTPLHPYLKSIVFLPCWYICTHVGSVRNCFFFLFFLDRHLASVPVRLFQTAAVMCHCEPGSDWPDGLAQTADNYSGCSAHAEYGRFRSEHYWVIHFSIKSFYFLI